MKHIVHEINIFTGVILGCYEFEDAGEALGWAFTMNQAMSATPLRYKFMQ